MRSPSPAPSAGRPGVATTTTLSSALTGARDRVVWFTRSLLHRLPPLPTLPHLPRLPISVPFPRLPNLPNFLRFRSLQRFRDVVPIVIYVATAYTIVAVVLCQIYYLLFYLLPDSYFIHTQLADLCEICQDASKLFMFTKLDGKMKCKHRCPQKFIQ